jgi:hypothetical protein
MQHPPPLRLLLPLLISHLLFLSAPATAAPPLSPWWRAGPATRASTFSLVTLTLTPGAYANATDNTHLLRAALANATPGTTVRIPPAPAPFSHYYLDGGNIFSGLHNVTLQIDGDLRAKDNCFDGCWPLDERPQAQPTGGYANFFEFDSCTHLTIRGAGRLNGMGKVRRVGASVAAVCLRRLLGSVVSPPACWQ